MPTSLVQNESILAIEVGSATTRAVLFDVVEGQYRFVAAGRAPSTAEAPFRDIGIGVREAISSLQEVTGGRLLGQDGNLIAPSQPDGSGVDSAVATISAGPIVRTVIVGLLPDVSIGSARHLAESTYSRVVETLDLSDHRKPDQQLDAILRARPDLVILTGGTDGGASRSMMKMLETVGLACYLMPQQKRPMALYAGNRELAGDVQELLGEHAGMLKISHNVRPALDEEDATSASGELAALFVNLRQRQLKGVDELNLWTGGNILPTSYAQGRMVRFLSRQYESTRGLLSVNIGASATTVAAGFGGDLVLRTYPQFGLGENLSGLLQHTDLESIMRWLPLDISPNTLREYLFQKSLYPGTLPATSDDQAIAQAIARQVMYLAVRAARRSFPVGGQASRDVLPSLDLIVAGGGAVSDGLSLGQSLLMLLDAIQPVGILPILIDQNNLLPLLGVAAARNNYLPVQVIDSGAFIGLGTVVSVSASAKYGEQILRAKMTYSDGTDARVDLKFGGLEVLPLSSGQTARLSLQPLQRADAGLGPGRSGSVTVTGGAMGVVIDGRGRPLQLPSDPVRRRETIKKWYYTVGG
ncbi:MAG: glutamate mutase L [Anaerolineales bacterium]|nr:glutamate mutase L [Anaerolineales bacterium]NUQ84247.1 glutamate mutase L [Anaerolineales bacterium]